MRKSQCFVYTTAKMARETTCSSVMMRVFALISILHVFGHVSRMHTSSTLAGNSFSSSLHLLPPSVPEYVGQDLAWTMT